MGTTQAVVPDFWQMQVSKLEASLKALEDAIRARGGNPKELMDLFRTNKEYADLIAQAMIRRGHVDSADLRLVKALMGNSNVFDAADWMAFYGVKFTKKQLRQANQLPLYFSEDVLTSPCKFNPGKQVKDTHFAFLGISGINGQPLTVAKWLEIHSATGQPRFCFNTNPWHKGQPYTDTATLELKWYLLLKEIVPESTNQTVEDMDKMLPAQYERPTTIAEVTKDILAFRKTGVWLNPAHWAACRERTIETAGVDAGCISCVGDFDEHGLDISYWHGNRLGIVGLGAARKS